MSDGLPPASAPDLSLTEEDKARRAKRSRAIGWAIAGLVVLFYVITVLKMGPAILKRPL